MSATLKLTHKGNRSGVRRSTYEVVVDVSGSGRWK